MSVLDVLAVAAGFAIVGVLSEMWRGRRFGKRSK